MKDVFNAKQIHILNTAEELFSTKGFEGTSVRDICHKANVNVAMISYYFGSKEKMLIALYQFRLEKARENLGSFSETIKNARPANQLQEMLNFIISQILQVTDLHGTITRDFLNNPDIRKYMTSYYQLCNDKFNEIMLKGVASGDFRNPVRPENILATVIGSIVFMVKNKNFFESIQPDRDITSEELEKRLRQHLSQTIYSLLGYEKI